MEELFKYLHLLNEARANDKGDLELYKRQQKVCDEIEKVLRIQPSELDSCGMPKTIVNNYYPKTNGTCCNPNSFKLAGEVTKSITKSTGSLI
jgi:hypothetical protein